MSEERRLTPLTDHQAELLEQRGISRETAVNLGWQSCEGRKDWIAIPFIKNGVVVNRKYRTLAGEKKFSQDKGGEQCLYNVDILKWPEKMKPEDRRAQQVVIVEGEMDCAIAIQCGYMAVSVPSGANEKPVEAEDSAKFEFLKDFPRLCIAVLAVDDDIAGHTLRQDLALRLGWHRCKWVKYPKGCKDLNDVFRKYGQKGVDKVLKEKTNFMNQGGLFKLDELADEPFVEGIDPQIESISDLWTVRRGDLVVVTGIPNMGKSTLVNAVSANIANVYAWNVAIASFETHPRRGLLKFLRTYFLEKPPVSKEGFALWTPEEIAEADEWINRRFYFIVPDVMSDEMTSLGWLIERIKAAITQHGVNMIIIDPWNEIDHDRPQGMSLTEYVGFAIKELKRLCWRYMVSIIIVAHPAKLEKNKDGDFDMPSLYDISDSSHWKNKCDVGIVVHMLHGEDKTIATVFKTEKIREWGVMGTVGKRLLKFNPATSRYSGYEDFVPLLPPAKKKKEPAEKKADGKIPDKQDMGTSQLPLAYKDD